MIQLEGSQLINLMDLAFEVLKKKFLVAYMIRQIYGMLDTDLAIVILNDAKFFADKYHFFGHLGTFHQHDLTEIQCLPISLHNDDNEMV